MIHMGPTERQATTAPLPILDRPATVLRGFLDQGEPIPTGIAPLDDRLRGGMRLGKALVIGGTPHAGKTSMAVQVFLAAAQAGCAVAGLFADEGREPAVIRLGQQLGYDREALEQVDHPAHAPTVAGLERDTAGFDLFFPDPDAEADMTIEGVVEALVQAYPDRRKVVVVDSIQTVRTRRPPRDVPSIRERIMDNAHTARRLALEYRLAVIYTSEVNRAWYRDKKEENRTADLAAFAEARIEFSADVLLALREVDVDAGLVEARIPKNRISVNRAPILLRLNKTRARFEAADPQAAFGETDAEVKRVEEALANMLRILRDAPGLTSSHLQDALSVKRDVFLKAKKKALESGFIRVDGENGKRLRHYLAEVPR